MEKADVVIQNGRLVNVATREILPWEVAVVGDRIVFVGPDANSFIGPETRVVDAREQFLVPGLISAHDHYEMTLMDPVVFAEAVLPAGTTAAVIDPHDTVNVMGMEGMKLLVEASQLTTLRNFFMVPACVPPAPGLEDAGCTVRLEDVQRGLALPNVLGLAEAMSPLRILNPGDGEMQEIMAFAREQELWVDGHCPELFGPDLCRYIASGPIRSDHESLTVEEQIEKLRLGMYVILRRGSVQEPMSAGEFVARVNDTSNILLAVDGCISVEDMLEHGHMSWAVRQIIAEGVNPLVAIQMATINIARAYGLDHEVGLIAPGRAADILFVDNLEQFDVNRVMVRGEFIELPLSFPRYEYPEWALATMNLGPVSAECFVVQVPGEGQGGEVRVRVIGITDGSLVSEELIKRVTVRGGVVEADVSQDLLKVAVLERYGGGTRSVAFIQGFGLKEGAFAGSIGQDSQNVVVVGAGNHDMACAVNRVAEINGGVVAATQGAVLAELPLPIAGIMTDIPPHELGAQRENVIKVLRELGCRLKDPIFMLSLAITLVVIPQLKMNNRGLVDVATGKFVSLFV